MQRQTIIENIGQNISLINRTQGGDFSFPYPQSGRQVQDCKKKVKDMFWNNKFEKQTKPLSWLIEKFMPVKDWTQNDIDNLK